MHTNKKFVFVLQIQFLLQNFSYFTCGIKKKRRTLRIMSKHELYYSHGGHHSMRVVVKNLFRNHDHHRRVYHEINVFYYTPYLLKSIIVFLFFLIHLFIFFSFLISICHHKRTCSY